jgi:hypothetical protein
LTKIAVNNRLEDRARADRTGMMNFITTSDHDIAVFEERRTVLITNHLIKQGVLILDDTTRQERKRKKTHVHL